MRIRWRNRFSGTWQLYEICSEIGRREMGLFWRKLSFWIFFQFRLIVGDIYRFGVGTMNNDIKYLTEKQVAEITQIALSTLRNDRFLGQGIPYIKIGRSVRYSLTDVVNFMESYRVKTHQKEEILSYK